jgi:hypothetical protein
VTSEAERLRKARYRRSAKGKAAGQRRKRAISELRRGRRPMRAMGDLRRVRLRRSASALDARNGQAVLRGLEVSRLAFG